MCGVAQVGKNLYMVAKFFAEQQKSVIIKSANKLFHTTEFYAKHAW